MGLHCWRILRQLKASLRANTAVPSPLRRLGLFGAHHSARGAAMASGSVSVRDWGTNRQLPLDHRCHRHHSKTFMTRKEQTARMRLFSFLLKMSHGSWFQVYKCCNRHL
ncbi:hypothetical protein PLESTF_001069600 [Pleodorina starrii]|nr:hypothetical protein PLESTF_001069600 [Pleodorina starrii]